MASTYVLKFPHVWLVSFPKSPSGFGDREEGVVLNVKGDAIVIYVYDKDLLVEMPLHTRIVKIKPVDINNYLADIKASFINNYDVNVATERLLRVYIADIEDKIAAKKAQHLERKESYSTDEGHDDGEEEEDASEEEEDEEEDEDEDEDADEESDSEESEGSDDDDDDDDDDSSSSSSSSSSSEEEDEDTIDFKVVIESSHLEPEVRGKC
jgi:hypothetical protein